ncbi:MAG: tetratricopeptide repeat protein [Gammaproteobacteria bacterium]|nr:tetratricopeptide repeat protein [Gammaproteobacteria bacterium]
MKAAAKGRALLFIALIAVGTAAFAQDTLNVAASADTKELLNEAEVLLAGGNSKRAYALLAPREAALSGNPYFDYLLGIAALDSGRVNEAIMSLRRAAAAAPAFSGARMELARALFEAGETSEARSLFSDLLDEQPPPSARGVLNAYVQAIDVASGRPPSRFTNYVEASVGHDSNANGSTDNQQFLGFALNPENRETNSTFVDLGAGFDWIIPTSARFAWLLGGRAGYRSNPSASFVDAGVVNGVAGMTWRGGSSYGRISLDGYAMSRDGDLNETYGGGDVLLGWQMGRNWDLNVRARSGAVRFDDAINILDVDRSLYSLGLGYRFASRGRFRVEAISGDDEERRVGSPYGNSKDGARLSLDLPILDEHYLYASVGNLDVEYDGLFFGERRDDSQLTSILQLEFRNAGMDGLTVAPGLRYVDNESDIALYDYDRLEVHLMFRWVSQ